MSNTALPAYSRFHAIISASPASGLPPRPAPYPQPALTYIHHNAPKRRRIDNNSFKVFPKVLRHASRNEHAASRQRPCKYASKDLLLDELKQSFKSSQMVDFHGSYELVESNVTHKQHVQSLTVDIWRATGYRFTVKDHPRINNGHKTRFWCSQDEAHRSKSSKLARQPNSVSKPRISSAGEALAKARYACKSRLLISSRDSSSMNSGKIITVRLHHHVAHEPYVDISLPPELARAVYESFGWPLTTTTPSSSITAGSLSALTEAGADAILLPLGYPRDEDDDADEIDLGYADADPDEDMGEEDDELLSSAIAAAECIPPPSPLSVRPPTSASTLVSVPSNASSAILPSTVAPSVTVSGPTSSQAMQGQSSTRNSSHSPIPHPSDPSNVNSTQINSISNNGLTTPNPSSSALAPNSTTINRLALVPQQQDQQYHYHQRMRAHISNIREFCSGLEYQLQFNDYRMLDVLEREGGSFLRLVQDCLKKEGRLDPNGEC